jgi:hypothetical protein
MRADGSDQIVPFHRRFPWFFQLLAVMAELKNGARRGITFELFSDLYSDT